MYGGGTHKEGHPRQRATKSKSVEGERAHVWEAVGVLELGFGEQIVGSGARGPRVLSCRLLGLGVSGLSSSKRI